MRLWHCPREVGVPYDTVEHCLLKDRVLQRVWAASSANFQPATKKKKKKSSRKKKKMATSHALKSSTCMLYMCVFFCLVACLEGFVVLMACRKACAASVLLSGMCVCVVGWGKRGRRCGGVHREVVAVPCMCWTADRFMLAESLRVWCWTTEIINIYFFWFLYQLVTLWPDSYGFFFCIYQYRIMSGKKASVRALQKKSYQVTVWCYYTSINLMLEKQ